MPQAPRQAGRSRWVFFVVGLPLFLLTMVKPGFAPATITEQRARLPPAAVCDDEVEGVWRSHYFHERYGMWYVMTLEVHRVANARDRLTGLVRTHYWSGGHSDQEPPPCTPGSRQRMIRQPAEGSISAGLITFGGTSWVIERELCPGFGGYNPDVFSGRIDPAIQEFQSVNNDGGTAVNVPVVFRRIRCFDPDSQPHVTVSPPPFLPPRSGGGCSAAP